jgi:hypothetical protein
MSTRVQIFERWDGDNLHPENRCIAKTNRPNSRRCVRDSGHGMGALYCKQHAKIQAFGVWPDYSKPSRLARGLKS